MSTPSSPISEWQGSTYGMPSSTTAFNEDHQVPVLPSYSATTSAYNYGQDQSFSFATTTASVLSTPSSSPATALNSNSTTTTYLEDEPAAESYCSDMLKFEIPESLDISDFL